MAKLKVRVDDGELLTVDVGDAPEDQYEQLAQEAVDNYNKGKSRPLPTTREVSMDPFFVAGRRLSGVSPFVKTLAESTKESFIPETPTGTMSALSAITPNINMGTRGVSKLAQILGEKVGTSVRDITGRARQAVGRGIALPQVAGPIGLAEVMSNQLTPQGWQQLLGAEGLPIALAKLPIGNLGLIDKIKNLFKSEASTPAAKTAANTLESHGFIQVKPVIIEGKTHPIYVHQEQLLKYFDLRKQARTGNSEAIKQLDQFVKDAHNDLTHAAASLLNMEVPDAITNPSIIAKIRKSIDDTVEEAMSFEEHGWGEPWAIPEKKTNYNEAISKQKPIQELPPIDDPRVFNLNALEYEINTVKEAARRFMRGEMVEDKLLLRPGLTVTRVPSQLKSGFEFSVEDLTGKVKQFTTTKQGDIIRLIDDIKGGGLVGTLAGPTKDINTWLKTAKKGDIFQVTDKVSIRYDGNYDITGDPVGIKEFGSSQVPGFTWKGPDEILQPLGFQNDSSSMGLSRVNELINKLYKAGSNE